MAPTRSLLMVLLRLLAVTWFISPKNVLMGTASATMDNFAFLPCSTHALIEDVRRCYNQFTNRLFVSPLAAAKPATFSRLPAVIAAEPQECAAWRSYHHSCIRGILKGHCAPRMTVQQYTEVETLASALDVVVHVPCKAYEEYSQRRLPVDPLAGVRECLNIVGNHVLAAVPRVSKKEFKKPCNHLREYTTCIGERLDKIRDADLTPAHRRMLEVYRTIIPRNLQWVCGEQTCNGAAYLKALKSCNVMAKEELEPFLKEEDRLKYSKICRNVKLYEWCLWKAAWQTGCELEPDELSAGASKAAAEKAASYRWVCDSLEKPRCNPTTLKDYVGKCFLHLHNVSFSTESASTRVSSAMLAEKCTLVQDYTECVDDIVASKCNSDPRTEYSVWVRVARELIGKGLAFLCSNTECDAQHIVDVTAACEAFHRTDVDFSGPSYSCWMASAFAACINTTISAECMEHSGTLPAVKSLIATANARMKNACDQL